MKLSPLRCLLRAAIFVALEIVLNRFLSYNTSELKIGFAFVSIALCGVMLGPLWAAGAGAAADFLGAVLFPIGAYFPGFTLTAALTGLTYGLFLHRKAVRYLPHILPCALICCIVLSYGLNTVWISVLYGTPISVLLITRLPQLGINLALQLALLPLLPPLAEKIRLASGKS